MHGLKENHVEAITNVFKNHEEIEKVILYGSRAKGTFHNGSDIDLTLQGQFVTLAILSKIETELDDLLLPYTIDLSIYSLIDNPDLTDHIDRVGTLFYKKQ